MTRFTLLDLSKLLQHDALVVITMMLIASRKDVQQLEIDNPLAALHCFLETFSEMDWNSFHVTALGIVPVTSDTADLNPKVRTEFQVTGTISILYRNKHIVLPCR